MRLSIIVVLAWFSMCISVVAQEKAADKAASGAVVAIEVVLADMAPVEKDGGDKDDQALIARIRELEKQGKLHSVTRLRLTTIEGQPAMLQFGERTPMATSRAFRGRGEEPATSYALQHVGTILEVTPRLQDEKVLLDCKLEQSRMNPGKPLANDQPDAAFEPNSVETITAKSTVPIRSGETAVLASRERAAGAEAAHTHILITATVQAPAKKQAAVLKVFKLARANAANVVESLAQVIEDRSLRVGVDVRTNSVIVSGAADDLDVVQQLLLGLDQE